MPVIYEFRKAELLKRVAAWVDNCAARAESCSELGELRLQAFGAQHDDEVTYEVDIVVTETLPVERM